MSQTGMIQWIEGVLATIVNFVFLGSKSILSSKNKPFVCGVYDFELKELCMRGRMFYPSKRSTLSSCCRAPWFAQSFAETVFGKLTFWLKPETRSLVVQYGIWLIHYFCLLIPQSLLPTIPNTVKAVKEPEIVNQEKQLPLILWSHGRGGNVHDHALMLSQMAVEVPAICVAVTHTDGSADSWRNAHGTTTYYRHARVSGQDERYLQGFVQMQEYQIDFRIRELEAVLEFLKSTKINFGKIIVGGFDVGGATALAAAARLGASGVVTIDGTFALEDRFQFPKNLFAVEQIPQPVAFILSDEYHVWNKAIAENTTALIEKTPTHKVITVKQTKHYNFIECMYWIPQIFLIALRISGVIHRRACPRKTYRRSVKWMVALIQQYTTSQPNDVAEFS